MLVLHSRARYLMYVVLFNLCLVRLWVFQCLKYNIQSTDVIQSNLKCVVAPFVFRDLPLISCTLTCTCPCPLHLAKYYRRDFKFDTVITNPPFGTKNNEGIDMKFLDVALSAVTLSGAVYSFHKTSTRDFILRRMESRGLNVEVIAEMKFRIPHMYKQHKKKEVLVDVDFIRTSGKSSSSRGS